MSEANHNEFVGELKESVRNLLGSKASVLLFGSRARGDNRADSDWDILVLLNRDGHADWKDYDEIGYPINEFFWRHNQDVNTIIQTRDEWQGKSFTPFYKNVMQDAIAL
jgi:predicted nucleotidyltransferase